MVEVSNPQRIMFPTAGITKGELVEYYAEMAAAMLPHLEGRPLTLERFPRGIGEKGFMQKNAAPHFPDSIARIPIPKKGGETVFPVVKDAAAIPYLANQGTITFHVWSSRLPHLERPDRMILDLDPPPGSVEAARRAAWGVREVLDRLELPSFVLATGSKGFHVITPLAGNDPFDVVYEVAQSIAALLAAAHPDRLTLEFQKKNRRDRVFVDWLRNGYGATSVTPWSVRPLPGAPVAVPVAWDELASVAPDEWDMRDAPGRQRGNDPWSEFDQCRTGLAQAHAAVTSLVAEQGIELRTFDRFRS